MKCPFDDEASEQCIHKQENGDCTGYCARISVNDMAIMES